MESSLTSIEWLQHLAVSKKNHSASNSGNNGNSSIAGTTYQQRPVYHPSKGPPSSLTHLNNDNNKSRQTNSSQLYEEEKQRIIRNSSSVDQDIYGHNINDISNLLYSHSNETPGSTTSSGKPPYSYAVLIVHAINSTPEKQMTLSEIYDWVLEHFPYYKDIGSGWKNSIRHNLSLNKTFVRVPRSKEKPGKGAYWKVVPLPESDNPDAENHTSSSAASSTPATSKGKSKTSSPGGPEGSSSRASIASASCSMASASSGGGGASVGGGLYSDTFGAISPEDEYLTKLNSVVEKKKKRRSSRSGSESRGSPYAFESGTIGGSNSTDDSVSPMRTLLLSSSVGNGVVQELMEDQQQHSPSPNSATVTIGQVKVDDFFDNTDMSLDRLIQEYDNGSSNAVIGVDTDSCGGEEMDKDAMQVSRDSGLLLTDAVVIDDTSAGEVAAAAAAAVAAEMYCNNPPPVPRPSVELTSGLHGLVLGGEDSGAQQPSYQTSLLQSTYPPLSYTGPISDQHPSDVIRIPTSNTSTSNNSHHNEKASEPSRSDNPSTGMPPSPTSLSHQQTHSMRATVPTYGLAKDYLNEDLSAMYQAPSTAGPIVQEQHPSASSHHTTVKHSSSTSTHRNSLSSTGNSTTTSQQGAAGTTTPFTPSTTTWHHHHETPQVETNTGSNAKAKKMALNSNAHMAVPPGDRHVMRQKSDTAEEEEEEFDWSSIL
eukprot:Nk52_evm27s249 gene=Nk52_evmTU27s249